MCIGVGPCVCVCVCENIKLRYSSVTVGNFVQYVRRTSGHSLLYCSLDKMERMDDVKCPCSNIEPFLRIFRNVKMPCFNECHQCLCCRVNLTARLFDPFSFEAFFQFCTTQNWFRTLGYFSVYLGCLFCGMSEFLLCVL